MKILKMQIIEHQEIEKNKISKEFYEFLEEKAKTTKFLSFSKRGNLKANQYVGIIAFGNEIIEIYPKVSNIDDTIESKQVLMKMLSKVYDLNIDIEDKANLNKHNYILDFLIEIFILLVEDIIKKGIIRDYVLINANEKFLKGRLDISKHIQKNFIHQERFYVEYDEYLIDCLENQIIKTTLYKLLKISKNKELNKKLRQLFFIFDDVSVIDKSQIKKISFNRLNKHYKKTINLAKLILNNLGLEVFNGENEAFSILFDMNKLFEEYFGKVGLNNEYKKSKKYLFKDNTKLLKPDFIKNSEIYDTKWKIINSFDDISESDLYQMLSYALKFNTKKVNLVYPFYEINSLPSKYVKICDKEIEFNFLFYDLKKDWFANRT
ncbi:hypothetical protein FE773_07420 [Caminibacter mediatlanticus TB-2]|uniref:Restriction endonuclease n=1 Tax=Caminibacter mediatlanticus TB-2 TaxID=391592 RepID=A0ABX5VBL4_9BACT|nr:hypothetical protein [Caminibacter mediatlanticus]QCT95024.1 hypothetical protein FE773_07420 [Caminibacter mediatlanticus TB-2]